VCNDKPFCKYWIDDICRRADGCLFEGRSFIFSKDDERWMEIVSLPHPQVGDKLVNIRGLKEHYDERKYKSASKKI
jgi:hypothetical protein